MSHQSDHSDCWTWQPPAGSLQLGVLSGRVDVAHPYLGLHELVLGTDSLEGQLLGVTRLSQPEPGRPDDVTDAYVRGRDLVATYRARDEWPYAVQVHWRADTTDRSAPVLASLTLLVSVQTDLLDSHPQLHVVSQLPAEEVLHLTVTDGEDARVQPLVGDQPHTFTSSTGVGCVLLRLPGGRFSCVEMVAASDFRQLVVDPRQHQTYRGQWRLFADFLEKGVIRRARSQVVIVPRADDLRLAAVCCRAFAVRPLPLTT